MPKPKTAAAEYERITLRLPPKVVERLRAQAAKARRPLNTHVIVCLETLFHYEREKAREHSKTSVP